ncbi:MAG: sigma-70 family RNA polymerase sigma factor [Mycobacteriales bacterium]
MKESRRRNVEPAMTVAQLRLEDTGRDGAAAPFVLAPVPPAPPQRPASDADPDAFIAMIKLYDRPLRALVYRLMGDRHVMDDVLQDVYLRAYRALPSFRGEAAPGTWLYRIAYNVCIDELRRRQRQPRIPLDEMYDEPHDGVDPGDEAAMRGDVAIALEALPMDQRAAVLLVDVHGFDYARAGEILGVPAGTVGSRVSRARATLRESLGGQR